MNIVSDQDLVIHIRKSASVKEANEYKLFLWNRYEKKLLRMISNEPFLLKMVEAEDVLMEFYLEFDRVIFQWTIGGPSSFRTYFYSSCQHRILKLYNFYFNNQTRDSRMLNSIDAHDYDDAEPQFQLIDPSWENIINDLDFFLTMEFSGLTPDEIQLIKFRISGIPMSQLQSDSKFKPQSELNRSIKKLRQAGIISNHRNPTRIRDVANYRKKVI